MIRKKKEVQSQIMLFVTPKKPDPQGWRLANHSRMYSQWAREVVLDKGRAYRMHDVDDININNLKPIHSPSSLRTLTSSASFSAASYYESEIAVEQERWASYPDTVTTTTTTSKGLLKNENQGYNNLAGTTVHQFQELRVKTASSDELNEQELRMAVSDEYKSGSMEGLNPNQGAVKR
jgi:hypothetical protein